MRNLIFIFFLIFSLTVNAQRYSEYLKFLKISQDPKMVIDEGSLDLRVELSFITENNNTYGITVEGFPNRDYYSFSLNYGHQFDVFLFDIPFYINPEIGVGQIYRKRIGLESWSGFYNYQLDLKFRIPLNRFETFGLYINNSYVRRTDLTSIYSSGAVKFRYNNYLGIYFKFE